MGVLVIADGLSHEWPGKRVLSDADCSLYEGDRVGIVGRNGDGKTTLLSILASKVEPDAGTITWRGSTSCTLLAQDDELDDESSVIELIVGDTPEHIWASDARIREILGALIGDLDWNSRVGELSGGQRRRVDLARVLAGSWDVLLLDEPTNHLDLSAIGWLAQHLKSRWREGEGALAVVTHDRWFLDEICTSMWEVHDGAIEPFEGGYSAYIQQRLERQRQAEVAEAKRRNILRKELAWLSRGPQARTSKPRFRIDEARALIADVPPLRNSLELKQMAMSRLGKQVIELHGAGYAYPGQDVEVVSGLEWLIGPGERIGILGDNGAGKTTLLKLMCGELEPSSGTVKIGASVRLGILGQRLEAFEGKGYWRVRELLVRYKRGYVIDGKEVSAEKLLERLGFDSADLMSRIDDLSGGQRRRLAIMCVLMEEPNVLVLDEPGNDLDTDMLAVLEDLLDSWPGTLLLVSHDRYLMERVTDDQYALIGDKLRHVPGGVDEYLTLLREARGEGAAKSSAKAEPEVDAKVESSLSNKERQQKKRRMEAVARLLEKAEKLPPQLELELSNADQSDAEELMRITAELEAARAQLASLEDEWLELSEVLS